MSDIHERAGTAYDPGAVGYELQGRRTKPQKPIAPPKPLDTSAEDMVRRLNPGR